MVTGDVSVSVFSLKNRLPLLTDRTRRLYTQEVSVFSLKNRLPLPAGGVTAVGFGVFQYSL